jgi:hypothetical protein
VNSFEYLLSSGAAILPPGKYWLVAWSAVDLNWGVAGQGFPSNMPPQSYLVNGDFHYFL